jgi:predicted DNA-binding transcriptional regulator AlpA
VPNPVPAPRQRRRRRGTIVRHVFGVDSDELQIAARIGLVRKRALARLLMISPWNLDRWRKDDPHFPKPVWISGSTPAWRVADIEAWLTSRQHGGLAPDWNPEVAERRRRGGTE